MSMTTSFGVETVEIQGVCCMLSIHLNYSVNFWQRSDMFKQCGYFDFCKTHGVENIQKKATLTCRRMVILSLFIRMPLELSFLNVLVFVGSIQ
jgi:hypothetical protein